MVKRIRGVSYSMKVSPQNTNRMVDGARGVLNALLSDVYIFTDAVSGEGEGKGLVYRRCNAVVKGARVRYAQVRRSV